MPIGNREASVRFDTSLRALIRRFFARTGYACLLGLSIPIIGIIFDVILLPNRDLMFYVGNAAGVLALVVILNTLGIGIVTFTSTSTKTARPPLWVLPVSFALLAGLLLAVFSVIGLTTVYSNSFIAFIVGAISGAAAGLAYALSIPGIRQDTILQQLRHSLIIGGVIGILVALYFFIKTMPADASGVILVKHAINTFVAVPITIVGLLLSFVLGIELGDRYVER